jgi:hypothetical protein
MYVCMHLLNVLQLILQVLYECSMNCSVCICMYVYVLYRSYFPQSIFGWEASSNYVLQREINGLGHSIHTLAVEVINEKAVTCMYVCMYVCMN